MRTDYSVSIVEVIGKEGLSKKEQVKMKDFNAFIPLDEVVGGDEASQLTITPAYAVVADVHNEKSDNKDYRKYIIVTDSGEGYVTGSETFWNSFMDIYSDMMDSDEEYQILIYKKDSNNYKGKQFLTCTIV